MIYLIKCPPYLVKYYHSVSEPVYFSNNDHAERFDMNVNPERLTLCEDVECKYYDVDNQLLNKS